MGKEIDDNDFDELLAEKRHKEISGALKGIVSLLGKEKPNDGIKEAIERQSKAIESFAEAIKSLPAPNVTTPEVNVAVSNDNIISYLEKMCKEICEGQDKILQVLDSKVLVDSFEVKPSGYNGTDRIINVKYKSASGISFNKPKAQA